MRIHSPKIITAVSAAAALLAASQAKATLTFNLSTVWNGATPTSSPTPWLTADFTTVGAGGAVTLTLTSHLNVAGEFFDDIAFNIDPAYLPSAVAVVQGLGPTAVIAHTTDNAQSVPGFDGPPGQGWDFLLSWPNNPESARFNDSDVATFTFTATGLTENDFNFLNDTVKGFLHIAADVQGIPVPGGGTTSGAISETIIPEATTMIAGGLLLLPFGASTLRILRRQRAA